MNSRFESFAYSVLDGWFSYKTSPVLQKIDLHLAAGRFYGLIGPNGSGKTTLLDLLTGTTQPQRGTVLFKTRPIEDYPKKDLARMLALVPQNSSLSFDFTVFEVVMMGRHPHIPRFADPSSNDLALVEEALSIMDIADLRDRAVTTLSGGERQRVVVARALAQNTEVIILDEATSSLDIRHSIEIMRIVHKRVKERGVTVIAAIHDLNLAASFCDEVIVLQRGRIAAFGPVADTLTQDLILNIFAVRSHVRFHPETQAPYIEYDLRSTP